MTHRTGETGETGVAAVDVTDIRAGSEPELFAYPIGDGEPMPLVPASSTRAWMNATDQQFANRCLPLLMANQAGWFILNTHPFRVFWDGGERLASIRIVYLDDPPGYPATSTFGYGIVTFTVPYLFRTSPGYNLLVRGPANWPKDGTLALEGLVETDWAAATFTMNWKLTRPDCLVTFDRGEPICMVVPQRRGELEAFQPAIGDLRNEPELGHDHRRWAESRRRFIAVTKSGLRGPGQRLWQKHYFHGTSPAGPVAPEHQTRLKLRTFSPRSAMKSRTSNSEGSD